jgi:hypothetical protein
MTKNKIMRNESDTAWKIVLDAYFKDFLDYCLPELYHLIDWSKPWSFLDKELQAITKGNEAGKRLLDKLVKVFLKDGREQWVLLHIEVQNQHDSEFAKRMFTYGYRIFDKYQRLVASCAILADEDKTWRPSSYKLELGGSCLSAEYLLIKLIDYQDKKEELDCSTNPFASVILCQLMALEAIRKTDQERKQIKFMLTKRLYDKSFAKAEIVNLYLFIDWLLGVRNEVAKINCFSSKKICWKKPAVPSAVPYPDMRLQ